MVVGDSVFSNVGASGFGGVVVPEFAGSNTIEVVGFFGK
jgi:hypothetical protein